MLDARRFDSRNDGQVGAQPVPRGAERCRDFLSVAQTSERSMVKVSDGNEKQRDRNFKCVLLSSGGQTTQPRLGRVLSCECQHHEHGNKGDGHRLRSKRQHEGGAAGKMQTAAATARERKAERREHEEEREHVFAAREPRYRLADGGMQAEDATGKCRASDAGTDDSCNAEHQHDAAQVEQDTNEVL